MSPMDPADPLASLMRVQAQALRGRLGGPRAQGRADATRPGHRSAGASDPAVLAAQRIRAIAMDDPSRGRKALRAFLECVLLSELGMQLVSDPAFSRMVDHVEAQISADTVLSGSVAQATDALLEQAMARVEGPRSP